MHFNLDFFLNLSQYIFVSDPCPIIVYPCHSLGDDDAKKFVGDSLVEIWKLKFSQYFDTDICMRF